MEVWNPSNFLAGDWLQIKQYDTDWVNDSWAENQWGKLFKIDSIAAYLLKKAPLLGMWKK
jgi:hypothetical protein